MDIQSFVRENNMLEGITPEPTQLQLKETERFLSLENITIPDLEQFVSVYDKHAQLRSNYTLSYTLGSYCAPIGGPELIEQLKQILACKLNPYHTYIFYEKLAPFTSCNGISGRAVWAHAMKPLEGSFLLHFYRQALLASRGALRKEYL